MKQVRIDVENLSFGYEKGQDNLSQISFHAEKPESIGLVGANGVGKSTFLKLLVGLFLSFRGSIRINDIPVEKSTLPQIRAAVGYVFQDSDSQLFMNTVYDDIAFAPRNYGLPEKEVQERTKEAMSLTGTGSLEKRQIYKLSGGEKKLVSIATVLSMMPEIILMDEPSIALDPRNRRNLIGLLNSFGQLKIIASHDLDFILDTCGRTVLMAEGKIICDGPTKDILTDRGLLEKNGLELPLSLQKREL